MNSSVLKLFSERSKQSLVFNLLKRKISSEKMKLSMNNSLMNQLLRKRKKLEKVKKRKRNNQQRKKKRVKRKRFSEKKISNGLSQTESIRIFFNFTSPKKA